MMLLAMPVWRWWTIIIYISTPCSAYLANSTQGIPLIDPVMRTSDGCVGVEGIIVR